MPEGLSLGPKKDLGFYILSYCCDFFFLIEKFEGVVSVDLGLSLATLAWIFTRVH